MKREEDLKRCLEDRERDYKKSLRKLHEQVNLTLVWKCAKPWI